MKFNACLSPVGLVGLLERIADCKHESLVEVRLFFSTLPCTLLCNSNKVSDCAKEHTFQIVCWNLTAFSHFFVLGSYQTCRRQLLYKGQVSLTKYHDPSYTVNKSNASKYVCFPYKQSIHLRPFMCHQFLTAMCYFLTYKSVIM